MIDKSWVEVLKLFNLGEYESKTYFALVMGGPSTVKEVRERAGIPYSREYDILEKLEKRGFVESQPGRPKRYAAVDPRVILKKECDTRTKVVEDLLDKVGPLYDLGASGEAMEDLVWTIRGRRNIQDKLKEMLDSAEKEVIVIGVRPFTSRGLWKALKDAAARGIRLRALGMFDQDMEKKLQAAGARTLQFVHDHSRYVQVDDRELILASEDPGAGDFALYNRNPGCIKLYKNYFEHMWQDVERKGKEEREENPQRTG